MAAVLMPGVTVDDAGEMHISIPDLLRSQGWPDTTANRERMAEVAERFFREHGSEVTVTE